MIDRFEELLRELGQEYQIVLRPDKKGACKLLVNHISIQIECLPEQHALLLASFIHELQPGKFRENVLRTALKVNEASPEGALLAYSSKNSQLTLFEFIPFPLLTGKKLAQHLSLLVKKAHEWRTAIDSGVLIPLTPSSPQQGSGFFGLKR